MFLFGGVGLAAAIAAMQRTTGRPVIWAAAQYLAFARPGEVLDLDVRVPSVGRHNSQARVIGHVGDREIITVNAALGDRSDSTSGQWVPMPDVPPPDACPVVRHARVRPGTLKDGFEERLVRGRYPAAGVEFTEANREGRLLLWVRAKSGHPIDAAMLAIIADFASEAVSAAVGRPAGGNSLDNTIRYVQSVETEWVLCDIQVKAVHAGTVHTATHLHAPDARLMATASQSLILRYHDQA